MNTITIQGENYVKAADLARDLGYTADYVGQLCRAGKVDAQLVGRSWYVSEDSIRDHKQTRYRGTKAADTKTIKKTLQTKDLDEKETFAVSVRTDTEQAPSHSFSEKNFYTRSPKPKEANYFDDDHDLIPQSSQVKHKTGKLTVSLGDAQKVKIKSKSKEYDFNPTERPEIKFTGKLSIIDAEEDEVVIEDVDLPLDANNISKNIAVSPDLEEKIVQKISVHKKQEEKEVDPDTTKIKVKHIRNTTKKPVKKLPLEHNTDGVLGMRRDRIIARNPVGGTLKVDTKLDQEPVSGSHAYIIAISALCSVILLISMFGLQSTVVVENGVLSTSYMFVVDTLLAAVGAAF